MSYVCTKKVKLGDRAFVPGDTIPDELFAGGRASKLISYGYIAEATEEATLTAEKGEVQADGLTVSIAETADGESVAITLNAEQLQGAVNIMRGNATEAAAAIADEVDESTLLFVLNVDSRKDVKKAAQKQLSTISSLKGDGDGSEE